MLKNRVSANTKENNEIIAYMRTVVAEYVDVRCGEVNDTYLAEDAIDHFDAHEREDQENFFECAFDVGAEYGRDQGWPE